MTLDAFFYVFVEKYIVISLPTKGPSIRAEMLQNNSFLENESQTETQTDDFSINSEELPVIVEQPLQKSTFNGGLLIVWGCGEFGQHGHGHSEDVPIGDALGCPLWLGQDRMVVEVACGSSHTMVLTDDNKIYSWGNSNSGQLGVGTTESSPHPRPLHLGVSSGTKLRGITCGTRHSLVWTQDGDCFSFGNNYSGQLGYDFRKPDFKENQLQPVFVDTLLHRPVSQVACGARHSVFLFTNGQVAAVGVNNRGQIGCGDTVDVICPKTIPDLPAISVIACGNSHNIAADVHGSVYVWGYSKACGSKADVLSPSCVYSSTEQNKIVDLAGGDSHSMILTSCGTVYSWGNNFEGQLGHGKSVKFLSKPTQLDSSLLPGQVVSVSVGENTSGAVTDDGKLYLWGKNASQVIRDDESSRFFQFEPRHVPLGVWKALKVSCGSWHVACVVFANQKNKKNEINEEKIERSTDTAETEVEDGTFNSADSVNLSRHEQEIVLNRELIKAVVSEPSPEDNSTPVITPSNNKQPFIDHREMADYLGIDANQTRLESIQAGLNGEVNNSEEHIKEHVDNFHSDNNGGSEDLYRVENAEENNSSDDKVVGDTRYFDAVVENDLEEKPAVIQNSSKNEEKTDHVIKVINEEKPSVNSNVLTSPDNAGKTEDIKERPGNTLVPVIIDKKSLPARPDASRARGVVTRDDTSTLSDTLHKVAPMERSSTELTPLASAEILESKKADKETNCASKEDDEFDYGFATFNDKSETVVAPCVQEEKPVIERKERTSPLTRTRAHSEQRNSTSSPILSQDISSALRSGSLESLKLYHQQEDVTKGSRSSRLTYSPPANARSHTGHLKREKRPARMLRHTSFDAEYHLPNQPVHTVDIAIRPYHLRPHPPINRTQSSPSLYSSNLIRSPLGSRRKSSVSAKVPRPPTSSVNSDEGLPPKPPARGIRRPVELNPTVFSSSGTSWRKRK